MQSLAPMYGTEDGDPGLNAFKQAEKLYQLHREQLFATLKDGRRRAKGFKVHPTDLSSVIALEPGEEPPPGVAALPPLSGMPPCAAAFSFAAHPGLLLVRGALPPELQRQLVVDALTAYNQPPSHTNHTRAYPAGLPRLWAAAQQGLRLQAAAAGAAQAKEAAPALANGSGGRPGHEGDGSCQDDPGATAAAAPTTSSIWGSGGNGPTAEALLRKLRWATLGPPYDWTQRAYLRGVPHMPLPEQLRQLAVALADLAARALGGGARSGEEGGPAELAQGAQAAYCPDAALVNFYYEGDTLNGHVDDAERCLGHPLVSLSLGCDAVFLMGGSTKDAAPTPLLLRSGDVVVLSGPARRCYHGVPRILTDLPLPEALRCPNGDASADGEGGGGGSGAASEAFAPFARHMERCRINISIRDTC